MHSGLIKSVDYNKDFVSFWLFVGYRGKHVYGKGTARVGGTRLNYIKRTK